MLLKEYPQALNDFSMAIDIDPKDAEAIFHRGVTRRLQGELQKAVSDMEKVLELSRDPCAAKTGRAATTAASVGAMTCLAEMTNLLEGSYERRLTLRIEAPRAASRKIAATPDARPVTSVGLDSQPITRLSLR